MNIGIIGSGNMGRAIGIRLAQLGYDVKFGARRIEQAQSAAILAGHGTSFGANDDAAQFGDVLIWTIRTPEPESVFERTDALNGKIVVDLNNRDYANDVKGAAWFDLAIGERLQAAAPAAKVVKALNTIAMETFDTSPEALKLAGAQTFLAGKDANAKVTVAKIVQDLGFEAVDLGEGPAAMRAAEALGDVIRLLMIDGGLGGVAHLTVRKLPAPDLETIGSRQQSNYH